MILLTELSSAKVRHVWIEIANGRGAHGSFLRSFAEAMLRADDANWELLRGPSNSLIWKYELDKYLDNFGA
jgi:hypothetical protein